MPLPYVCVPLVIASLLAGCDMGQFTVNTTSKVLARAQPALQQESDYELARQALPGALKTIEGFWIIDPENERLIRMLTEGYCQYGAAFVEDDWEAAKLAHDLEAVDYHNMRSTHIFTRCLNYALKALGPRWQKDIFGQPEVVAKLIKSAGPDERFSLMFAALALGSIINHNLARVELLAYVSTVQQMFERIIEIDKQHPPADKAHAAMPHIALGMLYASRGKAMGGDPDKAKAAFGMALKLTGNKMLLARTLMGYRVGLITNDRTFFHDQLKQVLETPPSVWPEQRLANEIAHRKARRYLSKEKELF
ncbi:MAG: TRAP transporter TatT component family protein [Kofleriaceae bacterium]